MKLVILDRDGTINHDSDAYIKSPEEWRPIPGSLEAIARLTQADYRIVVATNQSGIARGLFNTRTLFAIHDTLLRAAAQLGGRIDAFFFCPHAADAGCPCRKPQPGMLLEALGRGSVAVLAPSRWMRSADVLPRTWQVTSDSIAAFVAGALGATRLILIKLTSMGDPVDDYFQRSLPAGMPCTILGWDRVEELSARLSE